MRVLRTKLSYANVVATMALVAALGTGGAWAASKLINGSQIKPHTITAKQIKKRSLDASVFSGSLPQGERGPIGPPGVPGKDGTPAELEPEPPIRVGLGDSPCSTEYSGHFCNGEFGGWADYEEGFAPVAFFKDKQGFVHLQGTLRGLGSPIPQVSFYLPPGDRPTDGTREFTYRACSGTLAFVDIAVDGSVKPSNPSCVPLDGISFRP